MGDTNTNVELILEALRNGTLRIKPDGGHYIRTPYVAERRPTDFPSAPFSTTVPQPEGTTTISLEALATSSKHVVKVVQRQGVFDAARQQYTIAIDVLQQAMIVGWQEEAYDLETAGKVADAADLRRTIADVRRMDDVAFTAWVEGR